MTRNPRPRASSRLLRAASRRTGQRARLLSVAGRYYAAAGLYELSRLLGIQADRAARREQLAPPPTTPQEKSQ